MIQTRHMKLNNITMNDIQTRDFHIQNSKNLKDFNIYTWKNAREKEKINYIFNSFIREIDLGPFFFQFRGQDKRYITKTICDGINIGTTQRDCPVNLITSRYEHKKYNIKQELLKECKYCGDEW